MKINELLKESSISADNSAGRPSLVSLTKAINRLIYSDLVAIQPTSQPLAAIFGLKFNNPNNEMTFKSPATYGGEVSDRTNIADYSSSTSYTVGDIFKNDDIVYMVTSTNPFAGTTYTEASDILNEAVINGTVRYYSDAATTDTYEGANSPSKVNLRIDKWQVPVKSRKLSTDYTIELMQDMSHNYLDSANIIEDMLSQTVALEINKDIIQKLITVSSRYKVTGVSEKGILDVSNKDAQDAGRTLYRYIAEMSASVARESSFSGTYVLASTRVIAILDTSGLLKKSSNPLSSGRLYNGLEVYADITTPMDYVIVGVKYSTGKFQNVGSLFYAPYEEVDSAGSMKVIIDPDSLQEKAMILSRYALSVNPYTTDVADADSKYINGDDWNNLIGVSKLSAILGVKLPTLEK